jgi:hypothetical protein
MLKDFEFVYLFTNVQSGDKVYSLDEDHKDLLYAYWIRTTFTLE